VTIRHSNQRLRATGRSLLRGPPLFPPRAQCRGKSMICAPEALARLFARDRYTVDPESVRIEDQVMMIGERRIQMLASPTRRLCRGRNGIDVVVESTASTPSARRPWNTWSGRHPRGDLGAGPGPRRHIRDGINETSSTRTSTSSSRTPRARRTAWHHSRRCSTRPSASKTLHDDGARLHRRPEPGRRAPQGSAPPAVRHQHRPDDDRRREGHGLVMPSVADTRRPRSSVPIPTCRSRLGRQVARRSIAQIMRHMQRCGRGTTGGTTGILDEPGIERHRHSSASCVFDSGSPWLRQSREGPR